MLKFCPIQIIIPSLLQAQQFYCDCDMMMCRHRRYMLTSYMSSHIFLNSGRLQLQHRRQIWSCQSIKNDWMVTRKKYLPSSKITNGTKPSNGVKPIGKFITRFVHLSPRGGGGTQLFQVGVYGPDFWSVGLANWYLTPKEGACELKISKYGGLWAENLQIRRLES